MKNSAWLVVLLLTVLAQGWAAGVPGDFTRNHGASAWTSSDAGIPILGVRNDGGASIVAPQNLAYAPVSVDQHGLLLTAGTFSEQATAAPGAAGPSLLKVIAGEDGGALARALLTDTSGRLQVAVVSSALPTGAALDTTVSGMSAKLPATLGAKTTANAMAVSIASDQTVPVSSTQLPGALGANTTANSLPVTIASDQAAIAVSSSSVIDATNSSVATLAGNGTFTGAAKDILGYAHVLVSVFSDQSSAANGVKLEFSPDGTNWDDASVFSFTSGVAAPNAGQVWSTGVRSRFFRIVYTNGAVGQGSFRLQTVLSQRPLVGDLVDLSEVPGPNQHAILTKSSMVGKTTAGGGTFVDVKVAPSGAVTVDNSGVTQPISAASLPLPAGAATAANQNPVTGSTAQSDVLSGAAVTATAPANAVGFMLQALTSNTDFISWAVGATASATTGIQLQPGQDSGFIQLGANVSIFANSGTQKYRLQWVAR